MELTATLRQRYIADLEDGGRYILHEDENLLIERVGNGGVYVVTPFGLAFLPFNTFRWTETPSYSAETACAPSGLLEVR